MTVLISLCTVFVLLTLPVHAQNSISCSPDNLNSLRTFIEHLESGVDGWDFVSSFVNCCNWTGLLTDGKHHVNGDYISLRDAEDNEPGPFDKTLPCFGCGLRWFSFLFL